MYLRKYTDKRINKTYLSIARGYQNSEGKTRTAIVEYLGSLEELQKQYDDPISHFKEVVKQMNEEEKNKNLPMNIQLNKNEKLSPEKFVTRKNFGYSAFSKIYHELGIDNFFKTKFSTLKVSPNKLNNVLKLLVYGRLICPDSKKGTYENKDIFLENTDISLKEVYRFL